MVSSHSCFPSKDVDTKRCTHLHGFGFFLSETRKLRFSLCGTSRYSSHSYGQAGFKCPEISSARKLVDANTPWCRWFEYDSSRMGIEIADNIVATIQAARETGVTVLCLPEHMCISGYGCEDAFFSQKEFNSLR